METQYPKLKTRIDRNRISIYFAKKLLTKHNTNNKSVLINLCMNTHLFETIIKAKK